MSPNTATSARQSQLPHSSGMTAAVTAKGRKTAAMFTRRSSEVMRCRLAAITATHLVSTPAIVLPKLEPGDKLTVCGRMRGAIPAEEADMRQDVEFAAEGTTLRGWLYVPDGATEPCPAIVMSHGYSAVKELFLDAFAEVFADAGF